MPKFQSFPGEPFEVRSSLGGANEHAGTRLIQVSDDGTLAQCGAYCHKQIAISADFDNTEQDSGFDLPAKCVVLGCWLEVTTADSGETLDVGTDGSGSNDPNGFLAAVSVGTTGVKKGTLASGGQTLGALLSVDESGAGVLVPEGNVTSGGESVTYTGSAVTNTMRGTIHLVYLDLTI